MPHPHAISRNHDAAWSKGRRIWKHGMLGGRSEVEGNGGRNLYISRACADVWKGMRQLVYELTVLSSSLSLLPLSLSLSFRAVRCVSVSFGLALRFIRFCPRVPLHSDCAPVPFGLAFAVLFGLALRPTRFIPHVPCHSDLVYTAAYFNFP